MAGSRPGSRMAEWVVGLVQLLHGKVDGRFWLILASLLVLTTGALLATFWDTAAPLFQARTPPANPGQVTEREQAAPAAKPKPAAQAAKPKPAAPRPARIDRNGVLILIRSTLLALDQANKTGNYTVLRDLGAPGFRSNSAARLAEIFASQRRDKLDLSGVAAINPQLSLLPQIEANGMMRFAGIFPSIPQSVNFEMLFEPTNGQWRLFGLSVRLGQSATAPHSRSAGPAPPDSSATAKTPALTPSRRH